MRGMSAKNFPGSQLTQPILLSTYSASMALGVSQSTVRRLIRDGRLRAKRDGRTLRIPKKAITDYIRSLPDA